MQTKVIIKFGKVIKDDGLILNCRRLQGCHNYIFTQADYRVKRTYIHLIVIMGDNYVDMQQLSFLLRKQVIFFL